MGSITLSEAVTASDRACMDQCFSELGSYALKRACTTNTSSEQSDCILCPRLVSLGSGGHNLWTDLLGDWNLLVVVGCNHPFPLTDNQYTMHTSKIQRTTM